MLRYLLGIVAARLRKGEPDLGEVIELVRDVREIQENLDLCDEIIRIIAKKINGEVDEYDELQQVITFCRFYEISPSSIDFDLVQDLKQKIEKDPGYFIDTTLYNATDESDLDNCRSDVEEIEMSLGLDLGNVYIEIEDRIEEMQNNFDDYSEESPRSQRHSSGDASDGEIINIFEALKD